MRIHPLSDVQTSAVGDGTSIWQFVVVLPGAVIGSNVNICAQVFIENQVVIGNNVTIKSGVQLWDGVTIADDVFIGPNVSFTNDLFPRSKSAHFIPASTLVQQGASIGANATILAGITIGSYAMIGAGSVVTRDVPPFTLCYGNPAVARGYVTRDGVVVSAGLTDEHGTRYRLSDIGEPLAETTQQPFNTPSE